MHQPKKPVAMSKTTVVFILTLAAVYGFASKPTAAADTDQAVGQTLQDPCEVEYPEVFQRSIFEEEQQRKEIDAGVRRTLKLGVSHEDILNLRMLKTSLKHLRVGKNLNHEELQAISELTNLETLNLAYCEIDDQDLRILRPCLQNLKSLWLNHNPVTDVSMPLIAELSSLEELGLANSSVSDKGAERLLELKNLTMINLNETNVTDLVAETLAQCPRLKWIDAARNKAVTNKFIAELGALASLEILNIDQTSVNEDCVDDLIRMPNLRSFPDYALGFSAEASKRLRSEARMFGKFDDLLTPYEGPRYTYYKLYCIDGWTFEKLKGKGKAWEAVMSITGDVELPTDAHNIHAAEGEFGPDQKNYLVFSTTLESATAFAEKMTGKKLIEFLALGERDSAHTSGEELHIQRGFPWKAESVTDNKFSRMPGSNGGIVIDMQNHIVYLKR